MQNATVAKPKESNHLSLRDKWAVILCGGRGSRLGQFTDSIPKALVKVHDKAILWYCFLMLYGHGFRHFIFPLGYKGEMIKEFVNREFDRHNCKFYFVDTGEDTPISMRLKKIVNIIPESENFFLLNGDTFFEVNLNNLIAFHKKQQAELTLSLFKSNQLGRYMEVDLADDGKILSLQSGGNKLTLLANGGVYLVNPSALKRLNDKLYIKSSLENDLLPKFISLGSGLYGLESTGKFIDIGVPEDYYRAQKILKD